eukprot:3442353-Pyramimonas_sp.AAC.1
MARNDCLLSAFLKAANREPVTTVSQPACSWSTASLYSPSSVLRGIPYLDASFFQRVKACAAGSVRSRADRGVDASSKGEG